MTPRQRMLSAFEYTAPDRIPVYCNPSAAGFYVHGPKLVEKIRWLQPDNDCDLSTIPAPPATAFDSAGRYHEHKRDEWGTTWEYRIFGVHGHPLKYPVESWAQAADVYEFPSATAVPPAPSDLPRLRFACWVSLFEKLHALRPFEDVLVDLGSFDPDLLRFLDRLEDHWHRVIDAQLANGTDVIIFGDDWGTQTAPIVSLGLFDEIFVPRYRRLFRRVRAGGARVMFHSCGTMGPILDRLLELGINALWPQINLYSHHDLTARMAEHQVTLFIHPDRQHLVPRGTPEEIEAAVVGWTQRHHALRGGGVFLVEIENDAPWCNVDALISAIARHR